MTAPVPGEAGPGEPPSPAGSGTRASRRKMTATIAARARYATDSVPYPTGMPPAPVTADETRWTS
ncbi:MAG TPA: hypothetical protein VH478_21485 [Trebonia sp.]|nr:hypothetical protein [Trebonia sp.]